MRFCGSRKPQMGARAAEGAPERSFSSIWAAMQLHIDQANHDRIRHDLDNALIGQPAALAMKGGGGDGRRTRVHTFQ